MRALAARPSASAMHIILNSEDLRWPEWKPRLPQQHSLLKAEGQKMRSLARRCPPAGDSAGPCRHEFILVSWIIAATDAFLFAIVIGSLVFRVGRKSLPIAVCVCWGRVWTEDRWHLALAHALRMRRPALALPMGLATIWFQELGLEARLAEVPQS